MAKRLRGRALLGIALLATTAAALWLFPGPRLSLAFTLATGVGRDSLQERIDASEERAIARGHFSPDERAFLIDFYRTLATGAKLSLLIGQTGRMMDHYLDGSGQDYQLEPAIFRDNTNVGAHVAAVRRRLLPGCATQELASKPFHMPDTSQTDSIYGLYYGTVKVSQRLAADGHCATFVRAEVPWYWPTYESLKQKHGSYHAESFPLPNLWSLLGDERNALFVDNGLGQYLVELGLARPFLAFAQWDE